MSEASQKTYSCHTSPVGMLSTANATSTSQIRMATRPTWRLPAASWAEPGTTRVIVISISARR